MPQPILPLLSTRASPQPWPTSKKGPCWPRQRRGPSQRATRMRLLLLPLSTTTTLLLHPQNPSYPLGTPSRRQQRRSPCQRRSRSCSRKTVQLSSQHHQTRAAPTSLFLPLKRPRRTTPSKKSPPPSPSWSSTQALLSPNLNCCPRPLRANRPPPPPSLRRPQASRPRPRRPRPNRPRSSRHLRKRTIPPQPNSSLSPQQQLQQRQQVHRSPHPSSSKCPYKQY